MFTIVTDTSANLPTAYLQDEHITIIPFTFHTESGEQACMDLGTFDAKAFYARMRAGELGRILFCGTGALLSTTSTQQGESIPCICHAVAIERDRR